MLLLGGFAGIGFMAYCPTPRIEIRTLYLRTLCFRTTVPAWVLDGGVPARSVRQGPPRPQSLRLGPSLFDNLRVPINAAWREWPQVAGPQVAPRQRRRQVARAVHSGRSPCAFFESCTCGPRHAPRSSVHRCHRPVDAPAHILGELE